MKPENNAARHVLKVRLKLLLLKASILASHAGFTLLLNKYFFRLHKYLPLAVSMIPYLSFLIYQLRNKGSKREKAAHCRYSSYCSFYFTHQNRPVKSGNIDLQKIKHLLQPGDIILRGNTNYLVELIFTQNSHFTHVGICESNDGNNVKIMDCTGEHGVAYNSVEDFCSCDRLSILRFSVNDNALKETISKTLQTGRQRDAMWKDNYHNSHNPESKALKNFEFKLHKALIEELKSDTCSVNSVNKIMEDHDFRQVILARARFLEDASFDFEFDFESFDKFSCIEYVWYCLKCLYPLHRIKVSDFEYFRFITVPVIMPDVFIHNPFFEYVHSSIPGVYNKPQLQKHIKTKQRQLTKFVLNIALWDVMILCVLKIVFQSRSKR